MCSIVWERRGKILILYADLNDMGVWNVAIGGVHCWFRGMPSYFFFLESDEFHHSK